eukprot:gene27176-32832_t
MVLSFLPCLLPGLLLCRLGIASASVPISPPSLAPTRAPTIMPTSSISLDYSWTFAGPSLYWSQVAISSNAQLMAAAAIYSSPTSLGGIYLSSDYGATWNASSADSSLLWISVCSSDSGEFLAAADQTTGIYISSDYGSTWTLKYSTSTTGNVVDFACSSSGQFIYGIANSGYVLGTSNYGLTWSILYTLGNLLSLGCDSTGQYIVASHYYNGVYLSSDYGSSFNLSYQSPSSGLYFYGSAISSDAKYLLASYQTMNTEGIVTAGFLLLSNNTGSSWSLVYKADSISFPYLAMNSSGGLMLAYNAYYSLPSIYVSSSYGANNSWGVLYELNSVGEASNGLDCSGDGNYILATRFQAPLYLGVKNPSNLSPSVVPTHLPTPSPSSSPSSASTPTPSSTSLAPMRSSVPTISPAPTFSGGAGGDGYSWETSYSSSVFFTLASSSASGNVVAIASAEGIYLSSTSGYTWNVTSAPTDMPWRAVVVNSAGQFLYAAQLSSTSSGQIWMSSNVGETWIALEGSPLTSWTDIATDSTGQYIVASSSVSGVWTSVDNGNHWRFVDAFPSANWTSVASDASGQNLLAVSADYLPMYRSVDYGTSWIALAINSTFNYTYVTCSSSGNIIVAIALASPETHYSLSATIAADNTIRMLLISLTSGANIYVSSAPFEYYVSAAISSDGGIIAAASSDSGVYISSDAGGTWTLSLSSTSASWYGVAMNANGTLLVATSTEGEIFVALATSSSPTKQPSSHDDDDVGKVVDEDSVQSIVILLGALIPSIGLMGSAMVIKMLRRKNVNQASKLSGVSLEPLDIALKCISWFFFVLDVFANINSPGANILLVSRVPVTIAWVVIVYFLFQYSPIDSSSNFSVDHSNLSIDTEHSYLYLRQYLHSPSLLSNSLLTSLSDLVIYGIIVVVALFDLSLITYLPWKRTEFTDLSKGYPTLFITRCCTYSTFATSVLQTLASVVLFLAEHHSNVLAILFIVFSVLNSLRSIIQVLMSFLAMRLLRSKDLEASCSLRLMSRSGQSVVFGDEESSFGAIELRRSTFVTKRSSQDDESHDKDRAVSDIITCSSPSFERNPIHRESLDSSGVELTTNSIPPYLQRTMGIMAFTKEENEEEEEEEPNKEHKAKVKHADETLEVLRSQLVKAGILPLEYITLAEIRAELSVLFELINTGQAYPEARLDYLLSFLEMNSEYKKEKEDELKQWRVEVKSFALECLATMRAFIPPQIFRTTENMLTAEYLYSPALAKRILTKKCLWLVRMLPEDLDRLHEAELLGRFNPEAQNLDVVELSAIYAMLPLQFTKDPFEKKAKWRASIEANLMKTVADMKANKLSKEKLRCGVYKDQKGLFGDRESLYAMDAMSSVDAFRPRDSYLHIMRSNNNTSKNNTAHNTDKDANADMQDNFHLEAHQRDKYRNTFASLQDLLNTNVAFDEENAVEDIKVSCIENHLQSENSLLKESPLPSLVPSLHQLIND